MRITKEFKSSMLNALERLRNSERDINHALTTLERDDASRCYWDTVSLIEGMAEAFTTLTGMTSSFDQMNYTFKYKHKNEDDWHVISVNDGLNIFVIAAVDYR